MYILWSRVSQSLGTQGYPELRVPFNDNTVTTGVNVQEHGTVSVEGARLFATTMWVPRTCQATSDYSGAQLLSRLRGQRTSVGQLGSNKTDGAPYLSRGSQTFRLVIVFGVLSKPRSE